MYYINYSSSNSSICISSNCYISFYLFICVDIVHQRDISVRRMPSA